MAHTTVQPYIFFDGDCRQAVEFYAAALDAKLSLMTFADAPMELPAGQTDRVMHASLRLGDATIFASDGMPGSPFESGMRAHVSISTDDLPKAEQYFKALSEGGTVTMPFEEQFWGDYYGMLTDKFGVKWMINCSAD